ncbi:MAG TPA: hypothetical protein VK151_05135 [Fluviicola sp.]|nr:hypothetical protein [Fluviicola sp.]
MGHKKVCFDCRKSFSVTNNLEAGFSNICPECGNPATFINHKFRPPKKSDKKAWEVAEFLRDNGFYFQHAYEHLGAGLYLQVPYPLSIEEAKLFVLKHKK